MSTRMLTSFLVINSEKKNTRLRYSSEQCLEHISRYIVMEFVPLMMVLYSDLLCES